MYIQSLLHVVYWFNPALWLVARRLRDLREICCDAAVSLRLRERTREYGLTLLAAAARRPQVQIEPELGLLGLFENPAFLRRRIEYLAHPAWKHRRLRWIAAVAAAALVTLFVMPMAALKATSSADATSPTQVIKDINEKVAKFDLEKATREDVVAVFGEPAGYLWGNKTLSKENLPELYMMVYSNAFQVVIGKGRVEELWFENGSDYVFDGGLRVGSTLDEALKVMGAPDKTVETMEMPKFEDGVLYKTDHESYYARRGRGLRIFTMKNVVLVLCVTRTGPSAYVPADLMPGVPIIGINEKVGKLNLEKATREDVVAYSASRRSTSGGERPTGRINCLPHTSCFIPRRSMWRSSRGRSKSCGSKRTATTFSAADCGSARAWTRR